MIIKNRLSVKPLNSKTPLEISSLSFGVRFLVLSFGFLYQENRTKVGLEFKGLMANSENRGYGCWPGFFLTFEGFLKILEFILGLIAFALVLGHEKAELFSHYGFFIVVSALCWICALILLLFHLFGCCYVCCLGKWQKEYSLWIFLLSYALSFFFFFLFASALLAQWTFGIAQFIIATLIGFILTIIFFIEIIIYYRRIRKIRTTEVAYEGAKTRNI